MGRKSKITEKQRADIERRLSAGEKPSDLAREYGVNRSAISRGFSQQLKAVKAVANQIVTAEVALRALPVAQQLSAISLADQLRAMSGHVAGAAVLGAATAHKLAGIANSQVAKIDPDAPMESQDVLQAISALTKMSNDAASVPMALMTLNKDAMREPEPPSATRLKPLQDSDFLG